MLVKAVLTNSNIHKQLITSDAYLEKLFREVDPKLFVGIPKPPYVSLIGAVIGQIVRYEQAKKIRSNLYQMCGPCFDTFQITNLSDKEWDIIDLEPNKREIIHNINNYLKHNKLETADDVRKLKQINGIGKWTISTTILTSFLDWDEFPSGDLFIRKRIQKLYKMKKLPTISEVEKMSEKWKPYRTIVAWYFWR